MHAHLAALLSAWYVQLPLDTLGYGTPASCNEWTSTIHDRCRSELVDRALSKIPRDSGADPAQRSSVVCIDFACSSQKVRGFVVFDSARRRRGWRLAWRVSILVGVRCRIAGVGIQRPASQPSS